MYINLTLSFPEIIAELPAVTVTELPVELDQLKNRLDAVLLQQATLGGSNKSEEQQSLEQSFDDAKSAMLKEEQLVKLNEAGVGIDAPAASEVNGTVGMNGTRPALESNETAEEVPMPVFSEWAQKQMEAEASREQAMELEQQVVNNSAQRRKATGSSSGKPPPLKLRAKNYASPDCGAKIIASNADASNTGAVLSHSSDEYMLSTCGSRIWFVVELCEAVQAQKVELANFELFSSSPKNFTVAVSKRFPTRDWSNVGRFAAEDKRTVQTFELHPHLFGKFVRVDIHSHYSKEHFCPVSLFRVFGTSEFEAFETEIRPGDELDDFDDDDEQAHKAPHANGNIFQSASDAVMQMVKKAAEVLVKPTKALRWTAEPLLCHTPAQGIFSCVQCNSTLVQRINNLLSCQSRQLQMLLSLPQLRDHLLQSRVCPLDYSISLNYINPPASSGMAKRQSIYLSLLPAEHIGALCKLLQSEQGQAPALALEPEPQQPTKLPEPPTENVTTALPTPPPTPLEEQPAPSTPLEPPTPQLEIVPPETVATITITQPSVRSDAADTTANSASVNVAGSPADVNIFNVPAATQATAPAPAAAAIMPTPETPTATSATPAAVESIEPEASTLAASTSSSETELLGSGSGLDDNNPANWESIDSLLTTTVASITAGGGAAAAAAAVVNGNAQLASRAGSAAGINMQQKLTNGAQSESVFIRLSNRIKALERNMSLSGQYLEELSRRYKKQVEELQQTLTQQSLTVRTLEDQSRRYIEQEQLYQQQSAALAGEVRALTYQVQACILVIIIVGTCIFLMLVVGTVFYRKLRRQTQQLLPMSQSTPVASNKQKLSRRKSYEQMLEQSPAKQRRPSEEALLILKCCGDGGTHSEPDPGSRQRKSALHRRKNAKHSWHTSLDSAHTSCAEQLDKFFDVDTLRSNKSQSKASKKKLPQSQPAQELKRQESTPANYAPGSLLEESAQSDFDESLILDDDDLANFIPTSDLAYNEFMPEGPSGYQTLDTVDGKSEKQPQPVKKSRRVSSPAFFKSPFGKSKNKGGSFNGIGGVKGSHSAHEATSWEWYRLRRSEKQAKQVPNASLDSSSLSEINFPLNPTQNSFRILGEAIRSSGEQSCKLNGNGNGNGAVAVTGAVGTAVGSGSSSSGASTTSSTTKKKQRAFNNLFRKVF
ncbi:CG31678 [Drosophila busckii]|uniref:CG31678 n=1 Tax=Drosophila busckii TaxID=30019 RepID=A0A0M4EE96_DROBS|nr:CG31678 [Drosophila busckii]